MNSKIALLWVFLVALSPMASYAAEKSPVLREAQEYLGNRVAVTGNLMGDIFEVTVIARMKHTKPRIHNVIVVGPKLGRLSCETKENLVATTEEEDPFFTKRKDKGFINFGKDEKLKTSEDISESNVHRGTVTKALYMFGIPRDRIVKGKKYTLWVQIESSQRGGKYKTFKFDLENFAEMVLQQ